jgi:hypothetical protein
MQPNLHTSQDKNFEGSSIHNANENDNEDGEEEEEPQSDFQESQFQSSSAILSSVDETKEFCLDQTQDNISECPMFINNDNQDF